MYRAQMLQYFRIVLLFITIKLTIRLVIRRRKIIRLHLPQTPHTKRVQTRQHPRLHKVSLTHRAPEFGLVERYIVDALRARLLGFGPPRRRVRRRVGPVVADLGRLYGAALGGPHVLALATPGEAAEDVGDAIDLHGGRA